MFSCVLEKPKMLEALLGGKVNPKRLSQLPAGVALTRVAEADAPIEIQAWKPEATSAGRSRRHRREISISHPPAREPLPASLLKAET